MCVCVCVCIYVCVREMESEREGERDRERERDVMAGLYQPYISLSLFGLTHLNSDWETVRKLTYWVCGTKASTLEREKAPELEGFVSDFLGSVDRPALLEETRVLLRSPEPLLQGACITTRVWFRRRPLPPLECLCERTWHLRNQTLEDLCGSGGLLFTSPGNSSVAYLVIQNRNL